MAATIGFYLIVGFLAQLVDGALGMAYGVISTTFLLSAGLAPVVASASVHTAEVFTTAASGLSHLRLGNVDRRLFARLCIPGLLGGVVGAYILTAVPAGVIRPVVTVYLFLIGLWIIARVWRRVQERRVTQGIAPLALAGGFLDAIGGGGWGPIVTSTLVARGNNPRMTVGSVNLAEWFVTVAQTATFLTVLGLPPWQAIAGLIIGGVLAAPLAAHVTRRLPARTLTLLVGVAIAVLSIRNIYLSLR